MNFDLGYVKLLAWLWNFDFSYVKLWAELFSTWSWTLSSVSSMSFSRFNLNFHVWQVDISRIRVLQSKGENRDKNLIGTFYLLRRRPLYSSLGLLFSSSSFPFSFYGVVGVFRFFFRNVKLSFFLIIFLLYVLSLIYRNLYICIYKYISMPISFRL